MASDKRTAILDAMLDLVVERGFHAATMSTLAKKAGASPGVIYHYFPSKEDIIHTLYAKVKSEKRHFMLKGYSQDLDPAVGKTPQAPGASSDPSPAGGHQIPVDMPTSQE
jgi:AcrR family transcriptional regulator